MSSFHWKSLKNSAKSQTAQNTRARNQTKSGSTQNPGSTHSLSCFCSSEGHVHKKTQYWWELCHCVCVCVRACVRAGQPSRAAVFWLCAGMSEWCHSPSEVLGLLGWGHGGSRQGWIGRCPLPLLPSPRQPPKHYHTSAEVWQTGVTLHPTLPHLREHKARTVSISCFFSFFNKCTLPFL